jgi:hypothetical protein
MLSHGDITLDSDMSDRKSTLPQDSGQPPVGGAPASLSRRRFARGAAPVLLGTLASKPVLGAEYICTVSGHASGNASAHLTNISCDSGDDVAAWRLAASWPNGFNRGGVPGTDCLFTTAEPQGTLFNGTAGLAATFYYATTSGCAVGTTSGNGYASASMRQVLDTTSSDEVFQLGRAVVASLLNAAKYPSYPVSQTRIVAMFNAVKDGGGNVYHVEGANLNLTRTGVIQYLEKLYT